MAQLLNPPQGPCAHSCAFGVGQGQQHLGGEERSCQSAPGAEAHSSRSSAAELLAGLTQSRLMGMAPWGARRTSGLGSPCRSPWVSAPFGSGEESRVLKERGQIPPIAFVQEKLWGPELARLYNDTRGVCAGERDFDCRPGMPGSSRALWATLSSPKGGGHPAWHLGGDRALRGGQSPPSRVMSSPCQPCSLQMPDLQNSLQLLAEARGRRAEHQHAEHAVHGVQGLQGGQRVGASFVSPSHPQERDLNSQPQGGRPRCLAVPGGGLGPDKPGRGRAHEKGKKG